MVRPDVVDYLRENLSAHPVETLRKQLSEEGISEVDFADSLASALRTSSGAADRAIGRGTIPASTRRWKAALLGVGIIGILAAALFFALSRGTASIEGNTESASGESGFIGRAGWVVRLPKGYMGVSSFKDSSKSHQIVYFCKKDTDPTNFLNEGLFGQLGIIKLEVLPTPFPNNPTGLANLERLAAGKYKNAGEKFTIKNIHVATLPGISVTVTAPFPRAETFVLGSEHLYFFFGGQEDDIWHDIVLSLRDAHTEN